MATISSNVLMYSLSAQIKKIIKIKITNSSKEACAYPHVSARAK
jgi:hypothetical protein